MDALEDFFLYLEAESRTKNAKNGAIFTQQQVMDSLGISQEELDSVKVEIE